MNLNGTTSFLSAFDDNIERRDTMLRALTGELEGEERRAFEASLSPREEMEYRTLERLTTLIKPSVVGSGNDNLFFEQQWRTLMAQNQAFTNAIRQPVLPIFPLASSRASYGAVEILHYIPKATMRGFAAAASLCVVLLLGYMGFANLTSSRLKTGPAINKMKLTNLPPPPVTQAEAPPPPTTAPGPAARAGTPVPVPDALIAPDVKDFANVDEISRASTSGGDGNDAGYMGLASEVDTEVREEEADPYAFVPVEKEPYIDIKELQKKVVYPDLAKRAGIEGKVNIRVLVGKNGAPKKHIIESSDSDLLNDAAVRAVMTSQFTPAIQNNQPIDCWVSIPIVFRLR
jgi:TonB family protein